MLDVEKVVRIEIVLILWSMLALYIWACHRRLPPGARLALGFSLLMYGFTYYAGACWLFVFQADAIDKYFGGAMREPNINYWSLLLLCSLPLLIIPFTALLAHQTVFSRMLTPYKTIRPIASWHIWIGVSMSIAVVLVLVGNRLTILVKNAFDLVNVSGIGEIYERRRDLFDSMRSIQIGLLYGTLPASAMLILFRGSRRKIISLILGLPLAALTIILNVGLFQISPLMTFGLMFVFCYMILYREKIRIRHLVGAAILGFAVFNAYHSLKAEFDAGDTNLFLTVALRMPIALPYLYEMTETSSDLVSTTDSLSHELGEYMFPALAQSGVRFVAMPVPAFIGTWFSTGVFPSLFLLFVIGIIVAFCGWMLDRGYLTQDKSLLAMAAILSSQLLYYSFQVSLVDVLLSSYSIAYVALPMSIIFAIRTLSLIWRRDRWRRYSAINVNTVRLI